MLSQYIFDLCRIYIYTRRLDHTLLTQPGIEETVHLNAVDVAGEHSDPAVPMLLVYPISLF
jgi:hypothetical protein